MQIRDSTHYSDSRRFWIIFAVSFFIKGFFLYKLSHIPHRFYTPDGYHYKQLADNLIKYGSFATLSPETGKLYPEIIRTPCYPAFLATVGYFTPKDFPFAHVTAFIQIILNSLTCGLVYILSKKLFSQTAAVIAGLLSVFDITSSAFANLMLSDSLFVFLFFCSLYLLMTGITDQKKDRLSTAGLLLGLAALSRPIALYTVLIFIWLFFYLRRKILFHNALFFLLPFFLLVASWKTRNYFQTGNSIFSAMSYVFIVDIASEIKAEVEKQPFRKTEYYLKQHIIDLFEQGEKSDRYDLLEWEIIIRDPLIHRLCIKTLLEQISLHPGIFLKNYLKNLIKFAGEPDYESYVWCFGGLPSFRIQWSLDTIWEIARNKHGLTLVLLSQSILLFLLWGGFVYGTIIMFSSGERRWAILLISVVLYFTLTTALAHIEMRYRMPVIPILAVGAGYGLSKLRFSNK
jgi:4-amino-4-deoxy-L-arabinose transferase-like glycosyltransferase